MPELTRGIQPEGRESSSGAGYSPGVLVTGGQLLFLAGHTGLTPDDSPITDPEEQFVALFERMGAVLAEAGAGFDDLVEMTSYHVSFDTLDTFMEVKGRYLTGPVPPTWTAIGVVALGIPGALIEVKGTASIAA
jgi:enamine deaminase RidA (YjgF/YER057c/UK114 family)